MTFVKLFISILFVGCLPLVAQQPSWQNLRMGCTYSQFIGRTPVEGTQCTCTNCAVGTENACVEQSGKTALAVYSQGEWNCTGLKDPNASHPFYLYAHMQDDDQTSLRLDYSRDMRNWSSVNKVGSFTQSSMRDPSVLYDLATDKFYFTSSPSINPRIPIWSSDDLINYSSVNTINVATYIPGATQIWAPEWFRDPATNKVYIIGAVSTAADPYALTSTFQLYFFEISLPSMTLVGTPTLVTVNGSIQHRIFDFTIYVKNGTYYMLYIDQSAVGDPSNDIIHQYLAYATASSALGPYTQQSVPASDHFGVTDQVEGITMVEMPNGCVRMTYDYFINQPVGNGTGGRRYYTKFKDTCGGSLFSQGSLTPSVGEDGLLHYIANAEHGTIIKLDGGSEASKKLQIATAYTTTDSYFNSKAGVNTEGDSRYTFSVRGRAAAPGYIQYNEAASIGVDSGGGDYAMMAACGSTNNSCAFPTPGEARWELPFSHNGDMGHLQLSANAGTAEASILLAGGVRQFGRRPLTVARGGDKALWSIGMNSPNIGSSKNNKFFIYNRGIGSTSFVTTPTAGTLQNTTSGCYGMKITVGGSPINLTHMGRWVAPGNIGNHTMYLLNSSGVTVAQYTFGASPMAMTTAGADGTGYFIYTPVTNGLLSYYTMAAGGTYYIMSSETAGGDQWYGNTTSVATTGVASVTNAAFQASCGSGVVPTTSGGAGKSYGPVNFLYSSSGGYGGFLVTGSPDDGSMRFNWGITFGSGDGSAYDQNVYGSIDTFGSLPGPDKRINFGTGTLGTSDAWAFMGKLRVGTGINGTGVLAWMQDPDVAADTHLGVISNAGKAARILLGTWGGSYLTTPRIVVNSTNDYGFSTGGAASELNIYHSTAEVRATWGFTLGAGIEGGIPPFASIDAYGSGTSGVKRINLGTGVLGSSDATVLAKALDLSGYIGRRGGANNDIAGFVTLDGLGQAAHTFANASQMTNATCVCTVNSSLSACQNFISGGSLQLRGPAGANVTYVCIGAEY